MTTEAAVIGDGEVVDEAGIAVLGGDPGLAGVAAAGIGRRDEAQRASPSSRLLPSSCSPAHGLPTINSSARRDGVAALIERSLQYCWSSQSDSWRSTEVAP